MSFWPNMKIIYSLSTEELTSGNVSNLVNSQRKQNSCIDIDELIINKHIVNIMRLPSFFPGPKILYTNPSNNGDAFINRTTRKT